MNIASTRAPMSEPDRGVCAASKRGLVALTHAPAASLGPDVRGNCTSPGCTTPAAQNPIPRIVRSIRQAVSENRKT